jgi:hypothetical protein
LWIDPGRADNVRLSKKAATRKKANEFGQIQVCRAPPKFSVDSLDPEA